MHGSNIGPGFRESDLQRSIPYKILDASVREDTLEVAATACTVAVSLDGVMAPMKTGYRERGSDRCRLM